MIFNDKNYFQIIILAAGKSIRFKSFKSKLTHNLLGKPIIKRILQLAVSLNPLDKFIVVGENHNDLEPYIKEFKMKAIHQYEALGTGHALLQCKDFIEAEAPLLVMNADTPLMKKETMIKFLENIQKDSGGIYILTMRINEPIGYGRIVRDSRNEIIGILEESECNEEQKRIKEVNAGFYIFPSREIFTLLEEIKSDNKKGEYYLTDVIKIAAEKGHRIYGIELENPDEAYGINNRRDLYIAERILRLNKISEIFKEGVSIMDEDNCYIEEDVKIGVDTIIYPGVILEGATEIGKECVIYSNVRIKDSKIGDKVKIYDFSVIEGAEIANNVSIGPFARIRPESIICEGARVGNFVELKKTRFGRYSKANHLSYLGDAIIGDNTNIGAGTITCNYDGVRKNETIIEDEVFIGSDTQFVAPVRIGKGAYIAAGSTITKDVPPYSLGIARGRQENKLDWVKRKKNIK